MPRVRYTGGATYSLRGGPTWDDGDEHEVDAGEAERLCSLPYFERVDAADDDPDECGYYDPETMDSPCARAAGWGRDADDGPCKTHVEDA